MRKYGISFNDISVVVQGAIDPEHTKTVIASIRNRLPGAEIVLSTWEGSDVSTLSYDQVVYSKDPGNWLTDRVYNVSNNVNRQILSSSSGIKAAKRRYVLKLRSDIEIVGYGFIKAYSKFRKRSEEYKFLSRRVVINNLYCANPRKVEFPFHVSDWVFFGLKEDVLNIWDIPLEDRATSEDYFSTTKRPKIDAVNSWVSRYLPEQWIWSSFLRKNGVDLKFEYFTDISSANVEITEKSFANNLIILDYPTYGIKFLKYDPYKWDFSKQFTHSDWLKLFKLHCDPSYFLPLKYRQNELGITKDRLQLKKHWLRLIEPFVYMRNWLSEPFIVFYLYIRLFIKILMSWKQ